MRDERSHPAWLGKTQGLAVVGLRAIGIEALRLGGHIAEQVLGMGHKSLLTWSGVDDAFAESPRLPEPADQQAGSA